MWDRSAFHGRSLAIVGSICRDVKTAAIEPGPHLLEDGETPAAFLDETIGGGGANSALAAAFLGADVRFCGRIGDDALGERLERTLVRRGVKPHLRRDPATRTGSSIVLSYAGGGRHFVSCQPNNNSLAMEDVDLASLVGAEHLLRADVWFSEPMLGEGNQSLFRAAREQGLATSLDLNWDPQWGIADAAAIVRRKEAVRRVLPLVDLVHGNVRELNRFADSSDLPTTLRKLVDWGAAAVVLHLGADGAGYYRDGRLTVSPAVPVRHYQNTAGTGDLLSVCMMLLHRRDDIPLADRLHMANGIVAEFIEGRWSVIPELL